MKIKITYFLKCGYCNEINEFVARDKNLNESITDKDILKMMYEHSKQPHEIRYCVTCKLDTLQTRVAWSGTSDMGE